MVGKVSSQGSKWSIWDLHVHTPSSLINKYGGDTKEAWDKYIKELEALPPDIRVIGINDYWFLDGYKKVCEAKAAGKLKNLDAIFPVLEMRINQFGGSNNHLSRVNLHVLFDPALSPEVIEQQFINRLSGCFTLNDEATAPTWSGAVTKNSLIELGKQIKASVPAEKIGDYESDAIEGFNNLNVSYDNVTQILRSSFLKGKTLMGIGKAEWAQIKWNEQSIASKKTIINDADFVFTAFQDISDWPAQVASLRENNVTYKLFDCSDAHHFADSDQNERLGQCNTWLNTTPTFAGLVHALKEFDRRVYVGLEPPILSRIRRHPERFIDKITISSSDPAKHNTFDYTLPLNSGFVAVVGNKGQGKSAMLDCIALAGNSSRTSEFAFLTNQRFLTPSNRTAKEYYSEIAWAAGRNNRVSFRDGHDSSSPVSVEYLPQKFVERVCSADPLSEDAEEFERELREILFTHIKEEDRANERTFDALLIQKTRSALDIVRRARSGLQPLIEKYVSTAAFRAENNIADVDARLALKKIEINAAITDRAEAQANLDHIDSQSKNDDENDDLRIEYDRLNADRVLTTERISQLERFSAHNEKALLAMASVMQRAEGIQSDLQALNAEAAQYIDNGHSQRPSTLLNFEINRDLYANWISNINDSQQKLQAERERFSSDLADLDKRIDETNARLASRNSVRELARQKIIQIDERLRSLKGSAEEVESEAGLLALRDEVLSAPELMGNAREAMLKQAQAIYIALSAQLDTVASLYKPASDFIAESEVAQNAGLEFKAELRIMPQWLGLATHLDGRRSPELGSWLMEMPDRVADPGWEDLGAQLDEAVQRMETDRGAGAGDYRDPAISMKSSMPLSDFVMRMLDLSWLEVRIGLTGDGLPLSQLSPGQRGLILSLFYLVVDRRTTPLLLDQPEENLDNETIATRLVPAIHEAAGRRQTIVVTHNANLAIVGDADQIVHCTSSGQVFDVTSGCISEIDLARFAVNVLEGTKPAFDNRRQKYEVFPQL